jgi:hypothetical protein
VNSKTGSAPGGSKNAAQSRSALDRGRPRYSANVLQSAKARIAKTVSISITSEFRTESKQSGGLETNRPRERISGLSRCGTVRRFCARSPCYWASICSCKPAENVGCDRTGGEGGIRTASRGAGSRRCWRSKGLGNGWLPMLPYAPRTSVSVR